MARALTTRPAPFELYAFWRTSATYRVRVALGLEGIEARERLDAFRRAEPLRQAGAPKR